MKIKTVSLTIVLFFLLAFSIFPHNLFAATTGFTSEMVEISNPSISEGDEVELRVNFTNEEKARLTGKINFYNDVELLGTRELNLDSGQSGEFTVVWKAVLGTHKFIVYAENLKLAGSQVTILGPSTEPKEVIIGFKNSNIAERLREKGKLGSIVAGVLDEGKQFFTPIINTMDSWRISKIEPLQTTQTRINSDKENSEGKIKPILVVHSIVLSILLFIIKSKTVFFVLVSIVSFWLFVRIIKLLRRIFRKKYSEEE